MTEEQLIDPEMRRVWCDNIAMAFKDSCHQFRKEKGKYKLSRSDIHLIANRAAEGFIDSLMIDKKMLQSRGKEH